MAELQPEGFRSSRREFRWVVPRGAIGLEGSHDLHTPLLCALDEFAPRWLLRMHVVEFRNRCWFELQPKPTVEFSLKARITLSIKMAPDCSEYNIVKSLTFKNYQPEEIGGKNYLWSKEITHVSVKCEIEEFYEFADPRPLPLELPPHPFLGGLLRSGDLSDVLVRTADGDVPAHRAVLAGQSSVFAAMFRHPLKEATTATVDLRQWPGGLVPALLRWLYRGAVAPWPPRPQDLLPLADMYELEGLKMAVVARLHPSLSAASAVELLLLADSFRLAGLRRQALAFIRLHQGAVSRTPQWLQMRDHPALLADVFCPAPPQPDPEADVQGDHQEVQGDYQE